MNYEIKIKGNIFELTSEGLLWLPEHKLLCASDIHFEKSSFFSQFATLLPPYNNNNNFDRLNKAIEKYKPEIIIILSKDPANTLNIENLALLEKLNQLISKVPDWRWIVAKDYKTTKQPSGRYFFESEVAGITFRYEADKAFSGVEVSGRYQPKALVTIKSNMITAPCFVISKEKIMMPTFGKYTGGLNVDNMVKMGIIDSDSALYMAYKNDVYQI